MQAWNQWSGQASGATTYPTLGGGFAPGPVPAVPAPAAAAAAVAAVAAAPSPVAPLQGYPAAIGGYQWPNYPTPAVGTYPVAQWPPGQQTQQWETWQHWQQQYNQWQQQYGDKFGSAVATTTAAQTPTASLEGQQTVAVNSQLTAQNSSLQLTASDSSSNKRQNEISGDSATEQEAKKLCTDSSQSSETWATQKTAGSKDTFEMLSEVEKQFDEQFRKWENEFTAWREQNANHPDSEQYKAYKAKWNSWREQLLQRREQLRKKREAKLMEVLKSQKQPAASATASETAVTQTISTEATHTTVSSGSSTSQQPQQGYSAGAAPPVGMYQTSMYPQMSFPGYGFAGGQMSANYQLFGHQAAGFTAAPPAIFPAVPPPVVQPSSLPSSSTASDKQIQDHSKSGVTSSQTTDSSEQHSEFLKPSSGSGIPGLDLLNHPGGKPMMLGETPVSLLGQPQLPIQTPADSKPFDFPPPTNKYMATSSHQAMMSQMSMPPPGFPSGGGGGYSMSKPEAYSRPPPSLNSNDYRNDSPTRKSMRPMDNYPGPMQDSGKDWRNDSRRYDSSYNRFGYPGSDYHDRGYSRDRGGGGGGGGSSGYSEKWQSKNSYGGYPNNGTNSSHSYQARNDYGPPTGNCDTGGADNEEAEYERFHEYQQSGLSQQNNSDRRREGPPETKAEGPRGPRISRFSDRDDFPFKGNSPNYSSRPDLNDGSRRNLSTIGPDDYNMRDSRRFGRNVEKEDQRWNEDYFKESNSRWEKKEATNEQLGGSKSELPPLLEPMMIIDYKHQPADLGVPDIHEASSLIDYAHGAHAIPTEDEDNYPNIPPNSARPYIDPWNSDVRDRGRGGYDRGSPNRHWAESRGRTRWNSPGQRGREERRWEGKEEYKRDSRSRDSSRSKEDSRGREDRWRDRRKDSNHEDNRSKTNSRDADKKDRDRDKNSDDRRSQTKAKSPSPKSTQSDVADDKPAEEQKQVVVLSDDILALPGRALRSSKIVIILRGPPGSGKTFVAKLIKDKEVDCGGSAPRILSLDDYFMSEIDKEEIDSETGRKVTKKAMEYEYESAMEPNYRDSLTKSFRKTVTDGYFPFIIVDAVNDKLAYFEEMANFAKSKGFLVYICDMDLDPAVCSKRNVHKRTESEIEDIIKNWEKTPASYMALDVRSLLQDAAIPEVDMEDSVGDRNTDESKEKPTADKEENSAEKKENNSLISEEDSNNKTEEGQQASGVSGLTSTSKWDALDSTYEKLDRLDGLAKARRPRPTITDWLQLPEDYFETTNAVPGKKQVRWADLEERRQQEKMRAIGFVVGQTDWSRMLDPSSAHTKLTQTKYI